MNKLTLRLQNYILVLMTLLIAAACSDDTDRRNSQTHFCIQTTWQNGLMEGRTTRSINTDLLTQGMGDIVISKEDYPASITVTCSNNTSFTLTKTASTCNEHQNYLLYNPTSDTGDLEGLTLTATATLDGEELTATTSSNENFHYLFNLQHTKALLRFAFKVNEKYSQIRFIKITSIKLDGVDCTLKDIVLSKDSYQLIAYAYITPTALLAQTSYTLKCTYDVYDKDADFSNPSADNSSHITRKEVLAENTFQLTFLKDVNNNDVTEIKRGYFYDLNITLNPDYLHILSEHDNKHITIE